MKVEVVLTLDTLEDTLLKVAMLAILQEKLHGVQVLVVIVMFIDDKFMKKIKIISFVIKGFFLVITFSLSLIKSNDTHAQVLAGPEACENGNY